MTISFIVPAREWATVLDEMVRQDIEHSRISGELIDRQYSVHVIGWSDQLPSQLIRSDVVVARGILTEEAHRVVPNTPIVEIPFANEMAATAIRAVREHGHLQIGIIGSYSMCFNGFGLNDVIPGSTIRCYRQEARVPSLTERLVEQAVSEGCKILICGPNTQKVAAARGDCYAYSLPLSVESARFAMTRAKAEAAHRRRDREKAAQLQALLSSTDDGVITIDRRGHITAFNRIAESLLGVPAIQALNASLDTILPEEWFDTHSPLHGTTSAVIDRNGRKIAVKKTGVLMGQQVMGHVVTLRGCAVGEA